MQFYSKSSIKPALRGGGGGGFFISHKAEVGGRLIETGAYLRGGYI